MRRWPGFNSLMVSFVWGINEDEINEVVFLSVCPSVAQTKLETATHSSTKQECLSAFCSFSVYCFILNFLSLCVLHLVSVFLLSSFASWHSCLVLTTALSYSHQRSPALCAKRRYFPFSLSHHCFFIMLYFGGGFPLCCSNLSEVLVTVFLCPVVCSLVLPQSDKKKKHVLAMPHWNQVQKPRTHR